MHEHAINRDDASQACAGDVLAPRRADGGGVACQQSLDERFMEEALVEARAAAAAGEVPIGAVVVYEGHVIARAHNRRELDEDPSAHAEFSAMVAAAQALGRWRLTGCTVYVTLEPCVMCAGLMVNARIDRCVYGAADPKGGAVGSLFDMSCDDRLNHGFAVTAGVLEEACGAVLRSFFDMLRDNKELRSSSKDQDAASHLDGPCSCAPSSERGRRAQRSASPRVLLAIDSFKGSASSPEIEAWVAEGVIHACPAARLTKLPLADGGEGTLEAIGEVLRGTRVTCAVTGPLGQSVEAGYLLAKGQHGAFAVIEMAEAAGIEHSPCTHEAALRATTYGVGELLLDAVAHGARTVYFAIGGSATSDGGAGFLQALGASVRDAHGEPVGSGLEGLEHVDSVDLSAARTVLGGCSLVVLSDVNSPLVGRRGALATYGPQKGLRGDAARYDRWMVAYGRALDAARAELAREPGAEERSEATGGVRGDAGAPGPVHAAKRFRSVLGVPGGGAAGGLGAALLALGARMVSGAETVMDMIGFDDAVRAADLLITGEGAMDEQTARGKAPVVAAVRAKRAHVPVIAVVGGRADDLDAVYKAGIDLVLPIVRRPMPLEQALTREEVRANARAAGEAAIRAYLLRSARS